MMPFSRFDTAVSITVVVLLIAIGLTVLAGDRVGVQLERAGPIDEGHSTSDIVIRFSETMDRDTVTARLRIDPAIAGEANWSGSTLIYDPADALLPGNEYTVVLESGARSRSGRAVLDEYRFSFRVRQPGVAYLFPADQAPQNIAITEADGTTRQVTNSLSGIFDFAVSPSGEQIVYSERRAETATSDLKLLDLQTGALQQLVSCVDADCTGPVWRPDGAMIAYERIDLNLQFQNVGVSPPRIWLADLTTSTTQPLFEDTQILGYGPRWSGDGNRLALFDNSTPGILVYDFTEQRFDLIPSQHGTSGTISPDGTSVVYPELVFSDGRARSYLQMAVLDEDELVPLSPEDEVIDDDMASWSPKGDQIAIGRRYWDDRYTRGLQLYLMDPATSEVEPLVVDERYANGFFDWDPTGTQIVMQRFPELTEDGAINTSARPEIWTVDVETGELRLVASNAFHPRWVP